MDSFPPIDAAPWRARWAPMTSAYQVADFFGMRSRICGSTRAMPVLRAGTGRPLVVVHQGPQVVAAAVERCRAASAIHSRNPLPYAIRSSSSNGLASADGPSAQPFSVLYTGPVQP